MDGCQGLGGGHQGGRSLDLPKLNLHQAGSTTQHTNSWGFVKMGIPSRHHGWNTILSPGFFPDLDDLGSPYDLGLHMGMGQNPIPLVNIKIAGKWMFIPLKMVCIGIDP